MHRSVETKDAVLQISVDNGLKRLELSTKYRTFAPYRHWISRYSDDLIEKIFACKGVWVLDEIKREEDPDYVEREIRWEIFGYVDAKAFDNTRILDFGSGSGASSMVVARIAPMARIVGVELELDFVEIANARARFYGVDDRVSFIHSPDPTCLPDSIGTFDFIILSAVFEHLLPSERRSIMPLLWACLNKGGILFLNQTPHRWFPIEHHTTRLPLINYLPDKVTEACAKRFSARMKVEADWPTLLRQGIRGATHATVMRTINADGRLGISLRPSMYGMMDHFDLWYEFSSRGKPGRLRNLARCGFKALHAVSGMILVPYISMAIRKVS